MTAVDERVKNEIRIADSTGDTRIEWDKTDSVSVATAKAAFEAAKKKRHLIYQTDRQGNQGRLLHEFDPNAERIICMPQTVGG